MSYNSGLIVLVISNHSPDYSLNCTPLSPITITNNSDNIGLSFLRYCGAAPVQSNSARWETKTRKFGIKRVEKG